jgi:DNA-binding MarR family transcriptional regulator
VATKTAGLEQRIAAVRAFNRFYTRHIGLLEEGLLNSAFSLTEVRVLWELAHRKNLDASTLAKELGIDAGYLSRILRQFAARGFLERKQSHADGRRYMLALTRRGLAAFAPLNARSRDQVQAMLDELTKAEQRRLLSSMSAIERILGERTKR